MLAGKLKDNSFYILRQDPVASSFNFFNSFNFLNFPKQLS